jgi:hypothetical protein
MILKETKYTVFTAFTTTHFIEYIPATLKKERFWFLRKFERAFLVGI